MKLCLNGHNERYTVEQSLLALFPGELPVYETIQPDDDSWAVISCQETSYNLDNPELGSVLTVTTDLCYHNQQVSHSLDVKLTGSDFKQEGQRRHTIGACFFLAYQKLTGHTPPWGMLTGVRPDKLATQALLQGKPPKEVQALLENHYFVTPRRANLALETASAAVNAQKILESPRDIAVYIGIPFCPTRCAYCSFVSQSVEKSFALVEPYIAALIQEILSGGKLVRDAGLRVRALYMGGGTPTTLTAHQLDQILGAFEMAFDTSACFERTVEAGRPDTITAEKLSVLQDYNISRISVNPQTMEDSVLQAIGRRHSASDIDRAMKLLDTCHFPHVNMDFIAGLPSDSPEGFRRSLDRCLAFHTDNLTIHTLALKKGSRILLEKQEIPGPEAVETMLDYADLTLRNAGYSPYYLYRQKYMSGSFENIGWSRPDAACWYNIAIMSELCSILSFGAGGSTKMVDPASRRIQRVFNLKYPKEYIERPEKIRENQSAFLHFYNL